MNTQLAIGIGLLVGAAFLVACIVIGLLGYSPERAQAIRSAEEDPQVVIEEIRLLRIRRPDQFRHDRLDRHLSYVGLHIATQGYGWCVIGGATVTNNVATLSGGTRFAMASCFLVGSALVLIGASMGLRVWRWTIVPGVRENMTSSMLGDDVRLPYSYGAVGMFAISISMGIYGSTSFTSTWGSLGGWITALMAVMSIGLLAQFVVRIRTYTKAHDLLISEAVARLKANHVDH